MRRNMFAVVLLISMVIHGGNCRTIDEIILAAEQLSGSYDGNCQDDNAYCKSWAENGVCEKNPAYMHVKCKKSCNICSSSDRAASPIADSDNSNCQDTNAHCQSWATDGWCSNNPDYMHVNCKKSCNMCSSGGAARSNACRDLIDHCADYARGDGHCQHRYIKDNCQASCNLCSSSDPDLPSNLVKVELDMLFDAEEYKEMLREYAESQGGRMKRKAINDARKRWTDKVVPIRISNVFNQDEMKHIQEAVDDWNRYTCITFRPYRTDDKNYVNIEDGTGCSSLVGMEGGRQRLTLARGCRTKQIVLHELGHAVGFYHEQSRPDRNQSVEILYDNVKKGEMFNFIHFPASEINSHIIQYDYLSIMHYGEKAFSKNGEMTIRTLDPAFQDLIGNQTTLSFKDLKLANLMYKCGHHCPPMDCPGYGYVDKHCICQGSGVRNPDFTLMTDFYQLRGIPKPAYRSERSCLRHCATDPKCVAIDWTIRSVAAGTPRCSFHYEESGACDPDTGKISTSYRHYRYTKSSRCLAWRTTTPRPTRRPTPRPRPRPTPEPTSVWPWVGLGGGILAFLGLLMIL